MLPLTVLVASTVPYWRDPRIHNLGNVGFPGGVAHALLAPLSTRIIDRVAYKGRDVRRDLLREHVDDGDTVIDLCCGTGLSTAHVGVDTSTEMVAMARTLHRDKTFHVANAETWGRRGDLYDVVTLMFALHEMPKKARIRVLHNAERLARKRVVVVDLAPHYRPSPLMLTGEPYVHDYLAGVGEELGEWQHYCTSGTVGVWVKGTATR